MNVPPEISYRNIKASDSLDTLVRRKIEKLEEICDHISSCRVVVEQPERHQRSGRPYHVRLDISVPPKHRIAVNHEPAKVEQIDSPETEVRRAFDEAGRRLKKVKERQNRQTKIHEQHKTEAVVDTLFKEEGYGFLRTTDNRHIYFHRNALKEKDFDRLQLGSGVYFTESAGEKGPQASLVRIREKPGVGVKHSGPAA
ncbi:MAG: HPF/RaiA family ribosome-associated protein [Chitinivibrionales bacterium]|nr:HPF/RaiA family ribosome-associated protein [Chitinivibrionales bacterium]